MGIHRKAPVGMEPASLLAELDAAQGRARRLLRYQCQLVTPMYGGGVKAGVVDEAMPIRATAIRGQLRFWWRLLNARDEAGNALAAKALFEKERQVWGGLGDSNSLTKSRVSVSVRAGSSVRTQPVGKMQLKQNGKQEFRFSESWKDGDYALFPAAPNKGKDAIGEILPAGYAFELLIEALPGAAPLSDEQWAGVQDAVRWWAVFGGVGARTRRGLGAVKVTSSDGKVMAVPAQAAIEKAGCRLVVVNKAQQKAVDAWQDGVKKLKAFRQGVGVGRNGPAKDSKSPAGRSRWPEADAIRRLSGRQSRLHPPVHPAGNQFPRAAFGLPIITHFKDESAGDPRDTEMVPVVRGETKTRMASPLVLRPLFSDGRWYPAVLQLPVGHLRDMAVRIKETGVNGRTLHTTGAGGWLQTEAAGKILPMADHGSAGPLEAFLKFATKGVAAAASAPAAVVGATTLERPELKLQSNGVLVVKHGNKTRYLPKMEADKILPHLSEKARQRLTSRLPFSRLSLTLDGEAFVSLVEYAE